MGQTEAVYPLVYAACCFRSVLSKLPNPLPVLRVDDDAWTEADYPSAGL